MIEFDITPTRITEESKKRNSSIVKRYGNINIKFVSVGIWKDDAPWRRVELFQCNGSLIWELWTPSILFGLDEVIKILSDAGYINKEIDQCAN